MSDKEITVLLSDIRADVLQVRDVANVAVSLPLDDQIKLTVWPHHELKERDFLLSMCKIQNKYARRVFVEFLWPVNESDE